MSKQTAVEWLLEQLKEYDFSPRENTYVIEIPSWILTEKEEQAKAMEKEQIVDANISGMEFIPADPSMYKQDAEQYYNETYGN